MLVELREVICQSHGRTLLGPLSLEVAPRSFWGVVGPNGAGKTTLLKALAGIGELASGTRRVQSPNIPNVAFLFQHHGFVPSLAFTVEDVVLFGRAGRRGLLSRYDDADREACAQAIRTLGLEGSEGHLYRELSGGERQKVQLARVLAQEPDLLLLDEPAGGLDMDWQERLTAIVDDLYQRSSCAVVMVTHLPDHLPQSCTNVLLLKGGKALFRGTPEQTFKRHNLQRLYGGSVEIFECDGRHFFARRVPS